MGRAVTIHIRGVVREKGWVRTGRERQAWRRLGKLNETSCPRMELYVKGAQRLGEGAAERVGLLGHKPRATVGEPVVV